MRGAVIGAALAFGLSASPLLAQAAPQAPARPAPAQPAAQAPARPAPAPAPAPAAPAASATQAALAPPPPPFLAGAKTGFVNLQAIAQLTDAGKVAAGKVNALAAKKQTEGADKAKALQANQSRLQTSGSIMSDVARSALEKEVERQQLEGQRFEQDAQAELTELQQELQQEFQAKLLPVLETLAKEKGLQVLFSAGDSGVIWIEPGIDLTLEAVKRMDATTKAGAR